MTSRRSQPFVILTLLTVLASTGCQTGPSKQERVENLLEQAETYREQGLTDSALAAFGMALEENPNLVEAQMGMGGIWRDRGDYRMAREAFDAATRIDPNNFDARYNLGLMQQLLGDVRDATRTYLQALTINPDSHEANRDLAAAYMQIGEPANALPYAIRATELNLDSQQAWSNLAACYSLLEQYMNAVDAYRQAAELAPSGVLPDPVLLGLADAHIKLGNFNRAINTLQTLIRNSPSSTAYERLAFAEFKMREFERALRDFRRALSLDENDTAALNGVGVCLMTLYIEGNRSNTYQRDQAIESWRRSLKIRPNQPQIIDLLHRYGKI